MSCCFQTQRKPTGGGGGNGSGIVPPSTWKTQYDGLIPAELAKNIPLSLNASSYDMEVNTYQAINAERLAWMATGDTAYLDRTLTYAENWISTARVSSSLPVDGVGFNDSYLGWLNLSTVSLADRNKEIALFESYGWRYIALTMVDMQLKGMHTSATWSTRWNAIRAFMERNLWEKWYVRGYQDWMYRSLAHMAAHWAIIAMCQTYTGSTPTARSQAQFIWDAIDHVGMSSYAGASIRGQMHLNVNDDTAYWWDSVWNQQVQDATHHGQDASHGKDVLLYVIEAHRLGRLWTDTDIKRFVSMMMNHIWGTATATYSTWVDGTGPFKPGPGNTGYGMLCRYSKIAQRHFETNVVVGNWERYGVGLYSAQYITDGKALMP